MTSGPVIVVGGGWAGLACAVELTAQSIPVALLESARQLGGRARAVEGPFGTTDNGQHLLVGACTGLLALMRRIGADHAELLHATPLDLRLRDPQGRLVEFRATQSSRRATLAALAGATGLGWTTRARLLGGLLLLGTLGSALPDAPLARRLRQFAQDDAALCWFWEPLTLAIMNTGTAQASTRLLARVLRESLLAGGHASDLLTPRATLDRLLPDPAHAWLSAQGAVVRTQARVTRLIAAEHGIEAVELESGARLPAQAVVLATPHTVTASLCQPHPELEALCTQLGALRDDPITTLWFEVEPRRYLETPMLGTTGTLGQWVFDTAHLGQPGRLIVVISGDGPHMALDRDTLAHQVGAELQALIPGLTEPLKSYVIRERRATFSAHAGCETSRPSTTTDLPGLWLAGDYTATGLPATLEGAVRSGLECARRIARQTTRTP